MISLRVRIRENGRRFRELARETAPEARRTFASDLKSETLQQVVATTPVKTGRAKRGWQSTTDGKSSGEGFSISNDEAGTSVRSATNTVPYVRFLEYGTHRMAPREIVRRALRRVAGLAAGLFTLSGSGRREASDIGVDETGLLSHENGGDL